MAEVNLQRRAALAGPGWKGRREPLDEEARQSLLADFSREGLKAPSHLSQPTAWIDRRAKLFEAGDYPDKGCSLTEADVAELAKNFDLPVPILIEHATSPLQIGYLVDVQAEGPNLMGSLALTQPANDLIESSRAAGLSLGLSPGLDEIREVSLVQNPRIPDAKLFFSSFEPDSARQWRLEAESLRRSMRAKEAEAEVDQLEAQGRILPSQKALAAAALNLAGTVDFDGSSRPAGQIIRELLRLNPPHDFFADLTPGGTASPDHGLSSDAEDFYRRHFPNLSLAEIAQRLTQS